MKDSHEQKSIITKQLNKAVLNKDIKQIKEMIRLGADVDKQNIGGNFPLYNALVTMILKQF